MEKPVELAIKQESASIAMQLLADSSNIENVKEFLSKYGFEYSLDEIRSAGQLIVYGTTGPAILHPTDWVIISNFKVCYVLDEERVQARYDIRSINDY